MGIFSSPSPFDQDVEKVTDEKNMGEDWGAILDVCDKVKAVTTGPKDCLRAVLSRLNHQNPHVAIQAVTLLDACVNNCGKPFHLEVASRDCDAELRRLLGRAHPKVAENLRTCIKKWAEGEFKKDPQLGLIPTLYQQLKEKGMDFGSSSENSAARVSTAVKSERTPTTSQEEEDLAKAIELSLKESTKPKTGSTSLYSGLLDSSHSATPPAAVQPVKELRKVRALYDFEAAEDNELTFKAGEILHVLDDSDSNWWRGSNQRGEGLFPANFVTPDLSASIGAEGQERSEESKKSKVKVQFKEEVEVKHVEEEPIEIDESKMDRLLYLLQEADPTGERLDADELISLEEQVSSMGPLIDVELDKVDRKHAMLTRLSADLVEALNLYHSLMKEQPAGPISGPIPHHGAPQPGSMHMGVGPPQGPMYPPPHPYGYPPGPHKPMPHGATMPTYPPPGQVPAYLFQYPGAYGPPMSAADGQHPQHPQQQPPLHAPSHPHHAAPQQIPSMAYGLAKPFPPHPPHNL